MIFFIYSINPNSSYGLDTLSVYQNDTTLFESILVPTRPCSKPQLEFSYKLISPKDSTYYFIYNDLGLLVQDGMFTSKYSIQGDKYSDFYNSKYYYYKGNGRLSVIYYQVDGQNSKTEYYKRGKLKEVKIITR